MAKQRKAVKVLSTAALAGLVASAALSSQAFAKVDSYQVKVGEDVFQYDRADLTKSFLAAQTEQEGAELYEDFAGKMKENGLYAFHDDVKDYVSYESAKQAFLAAQTDDTKTFALDTFTESEEAEVVEIPTVKKATLVDGEVKYDGEDSQTGDLKVTSVSAINAAQIKVTFNKVLTEDAKDEATDVDNYTLKNSKDDEVDDIIKAVDAEEGSKEAIITVNFNEIGTDDEDYQNQAKFKLVLDEKITGEEVEKEFKVEDFDTPEVQSVEVAGIRTIKVKLSEPVVSKGRSVDNIYKDLDETFEINDGDYSIDKVETIDNGKELNIVLYSDLKDGEELKVEVKSEAEDYAGYSLKKGTFKTTVDVNKDDLAIVGYEKAKDSEITLVFNKDVKFHDYEDETKIVLDGKQSKYGKDFVEKNDDDFFESFYHTTAKNQAEAVEIDGNKLTLYFDSDHTLPETAYVTVDADTLEDLWEKKNNDLTIKAKITKDMDKPEIKEIEQDDDSNRKIKVTFTEDMDLKSAEKESNYTIKDKDKKEIRVRKATLTDEDEVTLELSKDLEDGDKYKVTIEDVEDKAGNKIADVTKEFVAKETQAVDTITARFYNPKESNQKIVVDFDTEMLADGSRYAINNLDNYDLTINHKDGKEYTINLSDYDDASIKSVEDSHKVEIKLPGNKEDKDDRFSFEGATLKLKVNKVEDSNENKSDIIPNIEVKPKDSDIGLDSDNDEPVAIDRETIKVTFADEFKKFEDEDISIQYGIIKTVDGEEKFSKEGELEPATKKVDTENGNTIVKYTLKESQQLNYNGTYGTYDTDKHYVVAIVTKEKSEDIKSENRYGDTLKANQVWYVKDEIAPELAKLEGKDEPTPKVTYGIKIDDRDDYKDAVIVSGYDKANNQATVRLYFEEAIRDIDSMKPYMFDTKDDDVDVVDVKPEGNDVIVLTLEAHPSDSDKDNYDELDDFVGVTISTDNNEVFDMVEKDPNKSKIDAQVEVKDATKVEEVDVTAIDNAIQAANAAKQDVKISVDGTDVAKTSKWVTKAVSDKLNEAIKTATDAKATVKTADEVKAAAGALDKVVEEYNTAKADGTKAAANAANAATVKTVKEAVEGATYTMAQADVTDEASVKSAIEAAIAKLDLQGVATEVTKVSYTEAVAGTKDAANGTNGAYTFTVKLSKGDAEAKAEATTTNLAMTITATKYEAPANAANAATVKTVKEAVEGATYTMAQADVTDEASVKSAIEAAIAKLDLQGVATEVTKVSYTEAVAGTKDAVNGTNGAYTFTVKLSKGDAEAKAEATTTNLTMTITATKFAG